MKRTRPEDEVFSQRRSQFQHPVLAPAPAVGLAGNYDQMQEGMRPYNSAELAAAQVFP